MNAKLLQMPFWFGVLVKWKVRCWGTAILRVSMLSIAATFQLLSNLCQTSLLASALSWALSFHPSPQPSLNPSGTSGHTWTSAPITPATHILGVGCPTLPPQTTLFPCPLFYLVSDLKHLSLQKLSTPALTSLGSKFTYQTSLPVCLMGISKGTHSTLFSKCHLTHPPSLSNTTVPLPVLKWRPSLYVKAQAIITANKSTSKSSWLCLQSRSKISCLLLPPQIP